MCKGVRAFALAALVLTLAGCVEPNFRLRYKLTLSVDTPSGPKTASSVFGVITTKAPASWGGGGSASVRGEAVYLDLGPGKRPLIAVMTLRTIKSKGMVWAEGLPDGPYILSLYGEPEKSSDGRVVFDRLQDLRGPRPMTPDDLPDLVTFADIKDPKSVLAVDPHALSGTLGQTVRWRSITIEVTDEPITTGIETKLPWLKGMKTSLSGKSIRDSNDLPSVLNSRNFKKD